MRSTAREVPIPVPRRNNRRAGLLAGAAACFERQGYSPATMRDIAAQAGMKAGSIYYYFPSKEELFIAVYEEGVRRISAAFDEAVRTRSGAWEKLEAGAVAHLETLLEGGAFSQVLMRWELPAESRRVRKRLVELRDGYEGKFAGLVQDLPLPAGTDHHNLRLMLIGALNFSFTWYRPEGRTPAQIARQFVKFLRVQLDPGS